MPFRLLVPRPLYQEMTEQAVKELPNECCGLLVGNVTDARDFTRVGRAVQRLPLINEAQNPTEYISEPMSLFNAHRAMRAHGWDILAIYHSHPSTDPIPSRTDRERNYYGSAVVHLIISLHAAVPRIQGWWLCEHDNVEADWEIV